MYEIPAGESFILHPHDFVLGVTMEHIEIPSDLAARLDGKSSWGRLGVIVHSTAGTVDPGFKGKLVLEITNISKTPVSLLPGARMCKLTFEELTSPARNPYSGRKDSKYVGQSTPIASRIQLELKR